jgi:hypoxanthine phosphoribosyltransferase
MDKHYISAEQLLRDAYTLAWQVYRSDYRPNFLVGIWRGGTPVAIAMQELLQLLGVHNDHIAIRTASYTGIGERSREVAVEGLDYLVSHMTAQDQLLLVDDVYDTGLSVQEVVAQLRTVCGDNCPQIRVATPYYTPANNQTAVAPDYFVHENNNWLVFPHELDGLSSAEISAHKPALKHLLEELKPLLDKG